MSTESEHVAKSRSDDGDAAKIQEFHEETRYAYKRRFLLSLAETDECKRLPSGFDSSILCELKAAAATRSSDSRDDSESGRRDGIQSLHYGLPRQNPSNEQSRQNPANEHSQQNRTIGHPKQNPANGLLGKRGLLRTPVSVTGSSAQRVQSCNLLNQSIAPYRPPHLYKMNLHSRRENKDAKNGETFGFTECLSHESVEVERRGRSSSEWTRKEHENAVQENRKNISDEHKENLDPEVATLLDDSRKERRLFNKCSQSEECMLSTPNDARPYSSIPRTIINNLLPSAQGCLNKFNELEECAVSSNPNDARLYSSMQSSIPSKMLPHELMSKSPEQNFETKSNKKGNQLEVTSLQLVSDDGIRTGLDLLEQESELDAVNDYDGRPNAIEEICLPDEDSLITSDDFKIPMDLVLLPESKMTETDLFTSGSRMLGNVTQMLAALNVPLDERSRSSLEVPTTSSGSDNKNGSETSHGNLRVGQCFPRSHHSQTNQGSALLHPSDSQKSGRSIFKPQLKNHSYKHPPTSYFPVYGLPNSFQDRYAASTSFDVPVMRPLSRQILVPVEIPHQVNGLPRGPSYPPINGTASYSQGPSQMRTSHLNNCLQTYRVSTMPNPGSNAGANSNPAAINKKHPEMEHMANQMHPGWPWTGSVQQFGR